ncbi:hypothetical protein DY123_07510 [Apilactobacillus micheneri]|uniref:helix-turn-helix domain-containing protein n=1 Tax=Apilactobacillus micheneri TaxID=1899430 RepID=UPI001126E383|nr:helix-turn-helix domain-containing protein [Apilactobacillus micheneri]TPR41210.1 hypothetical protein DY123_07510 [Apilactobacillus micheneri]
MNTKQKYLSINTIIPEKWHSQKGMNNLVGFNHKGKPVFNRFTNDLSDIHNYTDDRHDYYCTLNTFNTRKRSNNNIAGLNALYFDIDCMQNGISKDEFINCMYEIFIEADLFYKDELMDPSYVVDSGHGYYLVFTFKHQIIVNHPAMVKLWSKLERTIADRLNKAIISVFNTELCDKKATDPARLLRVPNTYNLKNQDNPQLCHIVRDENCSYDMFQLVNDLLPIYKPKKRKNKAINFRMTKNIYMLHIARCRDIEWLISSRDYDIKGCRETMLFIYATAASQAMDDKDKVIDKINELNNTLREPLGNREMNNLAYEINYLDVSKYRYSNKRIIEVLNITDYEQLYLKSIISKDEKYRRKNLKRNKIRKDKSLVTGAKAKRENRNNQIMELHEQGMNNTQIAKQLKISRSTVKRFFNK